MNRLLVIDDDIELCELLVDFLTPEGFVVETVNDGRLGLQRALSGDHSLVVLDVMLPGISGFDVLRRVREKSDIPIIMLTARGEDVDRVVGLEMGADDYLPKPFNPRELAARIRAIQRRTEERPAPEAGFSTELLKVGDIELDPGTRTARQEGRIVDLTTVEFMLLEQLLRAAGTVMSREELTLNVLGRPLSPYDRSIDVHISNLRKKLGPQMKGAERIKTVRGTGYQYAVPPGRAGSKR